jgi:hypothetical protein
MSSELSTKPVSEPKDILKKKNNLNKSGAGGGKLKWAIDKNAKNQIHLTHKPVQIEKNIAIKF